MNFKKLILVLFLTTITMFSLLIGFSYAWYATKTTDITIKTPTLIDIGVEFETSEYISTEVGIPILDSEAELLADNTKFLVGTNTDMSFTASYTIGLKDIEIADKLKIDLFKWRLLKNGVKVAEDNFSLIGDETSINLYTDTLVEDATTPDEYILLVWLSETGESQNDLMVQDFQARVFVKTVLTGIKE